MNRQQLRYLIELVQANLVPENDYDYDFQEHLLEALQAQIKTATMKV